MSVVSHRAKRRHWCFTSFLETLPVHFDANIVRYCCYQREVAPESKRRHWQGYIEFTRGVRYAKVKNILGQCHLECRKGTREEAKAYCFKEATAISGTQFEYGIWRKVCDAKRTLLQILQSNICLAVLKKEHPDWYVRYHRGLEKLYASRLEEKAKVFRNVEVHVLVGPTGCGKTKKAMSEKDHFTLPAGDKMWFDGYKSQTCLIIDDFYGNIKYGLFLRILDGHELQLPIKGGFIWALWTKVIITSNVGPAHWYKRGYTPALERRITCVLNMGPKMSFID